MNKTNFTVVFLFLTSSLFTMDQQKLDEELSKKRQEKFLEEKEKYESTLRNSRKNLRSTRLPVQAAPVTLTPVATASASSAANVLTQNILKTETIMPTSTRETVARIIVDKPVNLNTHIFNANLEKRYQNKKLNPKYIIAAVIGTWACAEAIITLKNIPQDEWDNTPYVKRPWLITSKTIQSMISRPARLITWVKGMSSPTST